MFLPDISLLDFQNTVHKEYDEVLKQISAETGLSCVQASVLLFIANHPPCCTSAEIVRNKKISKAHVSMAVEALEEMGYIRQGACEGRRIKLCLAPKAGPVVRQGRKRQKEFMNRMYSGFSKEDMDTFSQFFQRILENLRQKGEL